MRKVQRKGSLGEEEIVKIVLDIDHVEEKVIDNGQKMVITQEISLTR